MRSGRKRIVVSATAGLSVSRLVCRRTRKRLKRAVDMLLPGRDVEISVLFAEENFMQELNTTYFGRQGPTDVIAFPQVEGAIRGNLPEQTDEGVSLPLGDIVICLPVARAQASESGGALAKEVELLAVHGLLHLLGYEDETPEGMEEMQNMQNRILGREAMGSKPEGRSRCQ